MFLLDTSGSMAKPDSERGESPIGSLNSAIEGLLPELVGMNENNTDAEIRIAILTFDSEVKWVTGETGLINPGDCAWTDLNADGVTAMGQAFQELDRVLSLRHGFMAKASSSFVPVLFLLSDGDPTDPKGFLTDSWKPSLQRLQQNKWYQVAIRVAVGYGAYNESVLRDFTGDSKTVLHATTPEHLKSLIRFVVVTSSRVATAVDAKVPTVTDDAGATAAAGVVMQSRLTKLSPDPNGTDWP
jgi:uncharacterized protein YegL